MKTIYWAVLLVMLHTWAGYLLLLLIISHFKRPKATKQYIYPYVTVLLTVHNEEKLIENRIKNLLETDYPQDLLEILVASDGSNDNTDKIVKSMGKTDSKISLLAVKRCGKSAAQNKAIPLLKGEIIVLTDAETVFERDSIKNLVRNFSRNEVGCASGRLILTSQDSPIAQSQDFYWKSEMLIRSLESKAGIFHTASGPIMAFRKSIFKPFESKYGDDCAIPLDVMLQGYKVIHENDAVAYDKFPSTLRSELNARIRMTLRNITCTLSRYRLLNPFKSPFICLAILSHKLFRWLTPFFMIGLFISNLFLLRNDGIYKITFYSQIIFYFLGFVGLVGEKSNYHLPVASRIFSFILANAGFLLGVLEAILGKGMTFYTNLDGMPESTKGLKEPQLISIIIPCRNEEGFVAKTLDSVIQNNYPKGQLEVLVIDGMSTDRTREIAEAYSEKYSFVKLLRNEQKVIPAALNIGIQHAKGEIIMRMDAHSIYDREYISKCARSLLQFDVDNVGGRAISIPGSGTLVAKCIAIAVSHPFGVGNSYFRIGTKTMRYVDTVPFGCFRRDTFHKYGLFDTEMLRNEDDEFNLRLVRNGGKVLLVPEIVSYYFARDTISKMSRMFFQYGYYKPLASVKARAIPNFRQLVPPLFVGCCVVSFILLCAINGICWKSVSIPLVYFGITLLVSTAIALRRDAKCLAVLPIIFFLIHFSYGIGYLRGIFDFVILRRHGKLAADLALTR